MDAGLPFRSDLVALVPGVGFRVVVSGSCQCAIDDRPAAGKSGDLIGPRPGDCPRAPGLDPALFAAWPMGGAVGAAAVLAATPATGAADLAAVPGPGAGLLLLSAVLVLALARPICRAACAFGDWFTAERGTGPGQCGWV